jgi:hypothetical protein
MNPRHNPLQHPAAPDAVTRADAVVAGTLCLMSCFAQFPLAAYAERVAANLAQLAGDAHLTPELRTVCGRLAERWDAIVGDARTQAAAGDAGRDTRPLH